MKKIVVIILLFAFKLSAYAQDKNVAKIAEYIKEKKDNKAKDLLDKLDKKSEYQSDVSFWFVRTAYYRNIAIENPNKTEELAEARKSYEKLVELDKNDSKKLYSNYIPSLKKDLYEGKNKIETNSSNNSKYNNSQSNINSNIITLTEIGQGKTKEAAKFNALRNAIEKAFGAFISSNTTILNDNLFKDEVVSVSSGNIQNFEILSEAQMPDGSYTSVVKATVSIGKLTEFCQNKGIAVEFKGGVFAANLKIQELNKKNETTVMENLFQVVNKFIENGFDYTIEVQEPQYHYGEWDVLLAVKASANDNLRKINDIISSTTSNVSLTPEEISYYNQHNMNKYSFGGNYFRSSFSVIYLRTIYEKKIPLASLNFSVSDGITTLESLSLPYESNSCIKPKDWPCLSGNNADCGYNCPIQSKYFIIKNSNDIPLNNETSRFLKNVNKSNYQEIKNSYCEYNSSVDPPRYDLSQLEIVNDPQDVSKADYTNYNMKGKLSSFKVEFVYRFKKTYKESELAKITEFKVIPSVLK